VFVETDRKSHVSPENGGWTQPIEELKFLGRISEGKPISGEGHSADDARFCLAIVGWAPVPGGRKAMEDYEQQVRAAVGGDTMKKIAGWRYLVQDKPPGTMLSADFIDSLKWMGEKGYSFDLGVDMRSGGLWQLAEAGMMMSQVTAGVPVSRQVTMVISRSLLSLSSQWKLIQNRPHVQARYAGHAICSTAVPF
jgi:L-rhamnono-1,4-lactonase